MPIRYQPSQDDGAHVAAAWLSASVKVLVRWAKGKRLTNRLRTQST